METRGPAELARQRYFQRRAGQSVPAGGALALAAQRGPAARTAAPRGPALGQRSGATVTGKRRECNDKLIKVDGLLERGRAAALSEGRDSVPLSAFAFPSRRLSMGSGAGDGLAAAGFMTRRLSYRRFRGFCT